MTAETYAGKSKKISKSKRKSVRKQAYRNLPVPHKKFLQYCAVKQSSDLSYRVNKPVFMNYCQELVQRGGIGALQKLLRDAINHNYEDTPIIDYINDADDGKLNRLMVVQENNAAQHRKLLLHFKKEETKKLPFREEKNEGLLNDNNTNFINEVDNEVHPQEKVKSTHFAKNKQPKVMSIRSFPSVSRVKTRIDKYVVNGDTKFLSCKDLAASDTSSLGLLYSKRFENLREYQRNWIKLSMESDVKTHAELYIALYNFYVIQYVLRAKRRQQDRNNTLDNRQLKRDYLKKPAHEYRIINSASSGAFSMIQSFFLLPVVTPEFRNVFFFFEGYLSDGVYKREHSIFNSSSYVSNTLSHILPSHAYDYLMDIILENGQEVYSKALNYFPKDYDGE